MKWFVSVEEPLSEGVTLITDWFHDGSIHELLFMLDVGYPDALKVHIHEVRR